LDADPEFETFQLGEDKEPISVESSAQVREASVALVAQSRRSIEIVSRNLDPAVYDTTVFADALRRFVLDSSRARVHIIVMDSRPILASGHRLVALGQQLSSFVEIRMPGRKHPAFNGAFLLADRTGSVWRQFADRFDGVANFGDRRTASDLGETFDQMWAHGDPDPNLRRLRI
jgi:ribosomal protein L31